MSFYMDYMARWPDYFEVAESANGDVMGYGACCSKYFEDMWPWPEYQGRSSSM